jgi:hypothetical protein
MADFAHKIDLAVELRGSRVDAIAIGIDPAFLMLLVNRTRNGTCVNCVVLVLWKEQAIHVGASQALSLERASAKGKIG